MGSTYYYTTYADNEGRFEFSNVRVATYGLQAWSNGSSIADVTTSLQENGVVVRKNSDTDLGKLVWQVSSKKKLFQIGDFDRYSYGFLHGGAPYQHALVASCPANLTYIIGSSKPIDWCFGQTYRGNWTVQFKAPSAPVSASPNLIVSLAGYSSGASSNILANGVTIGNMTSGAALLPRESGTC
jgi:rhamnogalacturonan endolyase